ncbi:MAG: hypothetical protein VB130_04595 [Clostridium sp.]|nr:hypothetical protein [Clostridium sp.]
MDLPADIRKINADVVALFMIIAILKYSEVEKEILKEAVKVYNFEV